MTFLELKQPLSKRNLDLLLLHYEQSVFVFWVTLGISKTLPLCLRNFLSFMSHFHLEIESLTFGKYKVSEFHLPYKTPKF